MSFYDSQSTSWNNYPLNKMAWKSLSATTDKKNNVVTVEAAYTNFPDMWEKNGTFSIQVPVVFIYKVI